MSMRYPGSILSAEYISLLAPNPPAFDEIIENNTSLTVTLRKNSLDPVDGFNVYAINSITQETTKVTIETSESPTTISITGLTNGDSYYIKASAFNIYGVSDYQSHSSTVTPVAPPQQEFLIPGTYTWIAPVNVTSVSAVAVGGGGSGFSSHDSNGGGGGSLAYKNNITVVPGQSYTVVVGAGGAAPPPFGGFSNNGGDSWFISVSILAAVGGYGGSGQNLGPTPSNPFYVGDGGGYGSGGVDNRGAGGGAGGYSGAGGRGNYASAASTEAPPGGGGGGGNSNNDVLGGGGGGTGIYGQGNSGVASVFSTAYNNGSWSYTLGMAESYIATVGGKGGSNGGDATLFVHGVGVYPFRSDGGFPGGGGGSAFNNNNGCGGAGGGGAVRIIWPGNTRQFPNTLTEDI